MLFNFQGTWLYLNKANKRKRAKMTADESDIGSEADMGSQLRWLERTPDKREVGGSSPLEPTSGAEFALTIRVVKQLRNSG